MKYIWEEKDITCGRYICREPSKDKDFKPSGWTCKWTFKIGFVGSSSDGISLICMSDGMITTSKSKKELVTILNKDEMIPMPHSWLIDSIDYMKEWFLE